MYTSPNFKTKKALKKAVANEKSVSIYQPGPFGKGVVLDGTFTVEGPHYPHPHRWYAQVTVKDGVIVNIL